MTVNGWKLYSHPFFRDQLSLLTGKVDAIALRDRDHVEEAKAAKLLATIRRYTGEIIPRDPAAAEFRQGNTLGKDNRHWFRAKFHTRYRLFFRFSGEDKVIVYVWMNGEHTLRKAGSKTGPYAVFRGMLDAGDPPGTMAALLAVSRELNT